MTHFAALLLLLAQSISKTIAPGVVYTQELRSSPPMVIHVVRATVGKEGVTARVALAGDSVTFGTLPDGREPLSRIAARHDALVAVNGDYFPFTGDPLGICVLNGKLISEPARNRGAIGWTRDGRWLVGIPRFVGKATGPAGTELTIHGINRDCGPGENVLWLPSGAEVAKSSKPCSAVIFRALSQPLEAGQPRDTVYAEVRKQVTEVKVPADGAVLFVRDSRGENLITEIASGGVWKFAIQLEDEAPWKDAAFAVGGGPWLVRDGQKNVDWETQGFTSSHALSRHPRTAIGHTAAGDLLLVVVEGRSTTSSGMSLDELAETMLSLGAHNALNLDGGGSSQMIARQVLVSAPSDGVERPTANAVLLFSSAVPQQGPELLLEPKVTRAVVGQTKSWSIKCAATGEPLPHSDVIWGCSPGTGRIDQFGTFQALKPGTCVVSAYSRGSILRSLVLIAPKNASSGN